MALKKFKTVMVEKKEIDAVYCNVCGQVIEKGRHDHITIEKTWGYHSNKDGETHSFEICEKCYDEFVRKFVIPVEIT